MRRPGALLAGVCVAIACVTHGAVVITGQSMEPTLLQGDICVYRRGSHANPGDMVTYRRVDRALAVHRVVAVGPRGELRTKGDANSTGDRDFVLPDDLLGRVVFQVPLGRYFGS